MAEHIRMKSIQARLLEKGVHMPDPSQVHIGDDVNSDRIEKGVVLFPGCRVSGPETLFLAGTLVGEEGPAVLQNVRTGSGVRLKSGFFQDAVFLEGASAGAGSHVRAGCILEEKASMAHTVGIKQTILFPYVTLGSLINFCDILMAGGTGPKHHSEVGSSYIHFNFTPDQDKATPSLLGDVPSGVMLEKEPIFLGGQGGLVGPCRLAFGTVLAAGTLQRKDELRENRLIYGSFLKGGNVERGRGSYPGLQRILDNNFIYIANLHALREWYRHVRSRFISPAFPAPLLEGLLRMVGLGIEERVERLLQLAKKIAAAPGFAETAQDSLHRAWVHGAARVCEQLLQDDPDVENEKPAHLRQVFIDEIQWKTNYLETLHSLDTMVKDLGRAWLQELVQIKSARAWQLLASDRQG